MAEAAATAEAAAAEEVEELEQELEPEPQQQEEDGDEFADEEWDEARAGDAVTVSRRSQEADAARSGAVAAAKGAPAQPAERDQVGSNALDHLEDMLHDSRWPPEGEDEPGDSGELGQWLDSHGLGAYAKPMSDAGYDLEILAELDDSEAKELAEENVPASLGGHRLKLKKAVKKLREQVEEGARSPVPQRQFQPEPEPEPEPELELGPEPEPELEPELEPEPEPGQLGGPARKKKAKKKKKKGSGKKKKPQKSGLEMGYVARAPKSPVRKRPVSPFSKYRVAGTRLLLTFRHSLDALPDVSSRFLRFGLIFSGTLLINRGGVRVRDG